MPSKCRNIKRSRLKESGHFKKKLTKSFTLRLIIYCFLFKHYLIDIKMVGSRVYVGGLPYGTRERDLEKFFKGYGRTRDILIKNGYGFVEFEDYRDADDAVYELNGKELLGERSVTIICYQLHSIR